MSPNKDKTGNDRQRRRREREKEWLKEHGFQSWEALHTALMNGETSLTPRAADVAKALSEKTVVAKFKKGKLVSERVISPRR